MSAVALSATCFSVRRASYYHEFCGRNSPQCGVPVREELVTVCVGVRGDSGSVCQAVARMFQNVHVTARIGTPCHSVVAPNLLIVTSSRKWHDSFVVTSCDTLEKFFEHFKILTTPASPRTLSRVLTPNCVPWRKPFVVPVSGLLQCRIRVTLTSCH